MLYLDLLPVEIITHHIVPKLDSSSRYILYLTLGPCRKECKKMCTCGASQENIILRGDILILPILGTDVCSYDSDYIDYFMDRELIKIKDMIECSSYNGNLKVLERCKDRNDDFWMCVTEGAICGGRAEILEWIEVSEGKLQIQKSKTEGLGGLDGMVCMALDSGKISILEYLVKKFPKEIRIAPFLWRAIRKGHLDVIIWVKESLAGGDYTYIFHESIKEGHIHILQWVLSVRDIPKTDIACLNAVVCGQVDTLIFLREKGFPFIINNSQIRIVAHSGYIDMLKYLHKDGFKLDEDIFRYAALGKKIKVLEYLHENGCPLHDNIWYDLVNEDSVEVANFLYTHGYIVPDDLYKHAQDYGTPKFIEYLASIKNIK